MKRFALTGIFPVLIVALLAADAAACNRCGLFGRKCRFAVHEEVVIAAQGYGGYAAPASTQTFNFVNSFPVAGLTVGNLPLSAQGQTVYGYSLASQAYAVDPAAVLNQAARLTSNAQALASDGLSGFNLVAQGQLSGQTEVAKILAQGQTASAALLAAKGADTPQALQSLSFRATVANGQLKVEQIHGGDGVTAAALAPVPEASLAAVVKSRCASCHTGEGAKSRFSLADPSALTLDDVENIVRHIDPENPKDLMPKGGPPLKYSEKAPFYERRYQLRTGR